MDALKNLPRFYEGQPVVYLGPYNDFFVKGEKYKVKGYSMCGCGNRVISVGIPIPADTNNMCNKCGHNFAETGFIYLLERLFAPIQESPFPSMTAKEVVEKELVKVSLN